MGQKTGGGGLASVPRVCKRTLSGCFTRREGREGRTFRGTVQSAWQEPPVRRKGGTTRLPARVSGRHVVRGRQSSLFPGCAWVTSKTGVFKSRRRGRHAPKSCCDAQERRPSSDAPQKRSRSTSHHIDKSLRVTLGSFDLTFTTRGTADFVGNTPRHCRLGLFQDSDSAGDLEDVK